MNTSELIAISVPVLMLAYVLYSWLTHKER